MKKFIQNWIINTLSVLVAVEIVHGIHYEKWTDLLAASLLLGILNAFIRPILLLLALPLLLFTLGLFYFVINGLVLYVVGQLLCPHFCVDSFWPAIWGALTISIVSTLLGWLTGIGDSRVVVRRNPPPRGPDPGGGGPVIDV
jgi:putative membrane protein